MKYFIRGKGTAIVLTDNDFIDAGGEGKAYRYGDKVCKIYFNPDHMIPDAKIMELGVLTRPNIIKPEEILMDGSGKSVGFTMKFAPGYPLTEFFTNGFRKDNNILDSTINDIVKIIVDTIVHIHDKGCLIVDGNELSYVVNLVNKLLKTVHFIDVDSYQTKSYKPTAIHDNTRDLHSTGYSPLTDWFGAAIVLCWLYVGVHPFSGGKHPKYKKKGLENMVDRMTDNISIFNKDVKLGSKIRDLSCIPENYRNWFIDLFENGNRCPPPGAPGRVVLTPVYTKKIKGTDNFDIVLLKEFSGDIVLYRRTSGSTIVTTMEPSGQGSKYNYFINSNLVLSSDSNMDVLLSKISSIPAFVIHRDGKFVFKSPQGNSYGSQSYGYQFGTSKFMLDNILYIKNGGDLISVDLNETIFGDTKKITASMKNSWNVMPHSSTMMDGFLLQKALGKQFLYIPVPSKNQCMIVKVPELDGYRIVAGKYSNNICMLVGKKGSVYNKIILRFAHDFSMHDCRVIEDVDIDSINFAVLDNGICASMEDGKLVLFRNTPNDPGLKSIEDPELNSSMRLWSDGAGILASIDNKLYSIKMRK